MAEGDETAAAADGEAPAEGDAPAEDAGGDGGDAGGDGGDAGGDDGGDAGGDDGGDAGGDDGGDAGGDDAPAAVDDGNAPAVTGEDAPDGDQGAGGDDIGIEADIDSVKAEKFAARYAEKTGIKSRIKLYKLCNMFEAGAAELLQYALNNPMEKENALGRRNELLQSLYYLRHVSDIDDDFDQLEFEAEMKQIKIFRSKIGRLAAKEDEYIDSDADESSDDELDDADDMDVLKEARKMMEFAFGKDEK